jgi:hypothetical protein
MNKITLIAFIAKAHRHTYAAPEEVRKRYLCETPVLRGHTDHEYSEGDLRYHDSYAGSTWAPGREVVFYKGSPVWCMAYQGQSNPEYDEQFFQVQAFPFLRSALMNFEDGSPFRGPREFSDGNFKYTFEMHGDCDYFKGQERIFYKGDSVFFQDVMGSLIR